MRPQSHAAIITFFYLILCLFTAAAPPPEAAGAGDASPLDSPQDIIESRNSPLTKYWIYEPRNRASLRILIYVFGTRGDCQPMLELARMLQRNGHRPVLVAPEKHREWIQRMDIEHWDFPVNQDLVNQLLNIYTMNGIASFSAMMAFKTTEKWAADLFSSAVKAIKAKHSEARDIDVVVAPNWYFFGSHIAEYLRVPYIEAQFFPITKTGDFDLYSAERSMDALRRRWPQYSERFSKITYDGNRWMTSMVSLPAINGIRKQLNIPKLSVLEWSRRSAAAPILYAISPALFDRPRDWSSHVHLVGYWRPENSGESQWRPSDELLEFFDTDQPVVYIDMGSMTQYHGGQQKTIEYLKSIGNDRTYRWIVAVGPEGSELDKWLSEWPLARDRNSVYLKRGPIPHTWLLPRVATFLTHGGAGSVAASYYEGTPVVVLPLLGDQVQNCEFAQRRGVGLCIEQHPTEYDVIPIIQEALKPQYKENVMELRSRLMNEDGEAMTMEALNTELDYIWSTNNQYPGQYVAVTTRNNARTKSSFQRLREKIAEKARSIKDKALSFVEWIRRKLGWSKPQQPTEESLDEQHE